jgi:hypothetical protein
VVSKHQRNKIIGVIYRPNTTIKSGLNIFSTTYSEILEILNTENEEIVVRRYFNIDLLQLNKYNPTEDSINNIFSKVSCPI